MSRSVVIFFLCLSSIWSSGQSFLGTRLFDSSSDVLLSNPASPIKKKLLIALPAAALSYTHNGLSFGDVFVHEQNGVYRINEDINFENSPNRNPNLMSTELLSFGLAYEIQDWTISLSHQVKGAGLVDYATDMLDLYIHGNGEKIGQTLDIAPIFDYQSYYEYGLGIGKSMGPWRLGLRLKYLSGISRGVSMDNQINLTTQEDYYQIVIDSDYTIHSSGFVSLTNLEDIRVDIGRNQFNNLFGPNHGFAVDLGVIYSFSDHSQIELSVSNLGNIHWKENLSSYTSNGRFTFEGLSFDDLVNEELEEIISDSLYHILDFQIGNEPFSSRTPVSISAAYKTQIGDGLHWRMTGNLHKLGSYSIYQIGSSLIQDFGWIRLGASGMYSTYSKINLGTMIELNIGPVIIFTSVDNVLAAFDLANHKLIQGQFGMNINL